MEVNTNDLPKNSEQWAAIDGHKNYQVSWWGRVRNAKTGRILKPQACGVGYLSVKLSKRGVQQNCYIHRLVAREWVENPGNKRCVDHIDGSRTNNHWANLRYATHSENSMNQKSRTDGSSIYKGVSYHKATNKWQAQLLANGKQTYLGIFESEQEAAEVYNKTALEHFGNFARINILESDL
jgi:hypothetical protein